MATMTVLGQDRKIRDRIEALEEMHQTLTNMIRNGEAELEERRTNLARVEGGIIELRAVLAAGSTPDLPATEEPTEERED